MPCHPDRVRRNNETDAEGTAAWDRTCAAIRQRLADRDQQAREAPAAPVVPDDGITANVIEGDDHNFWGV